MSGWAALTVAPWHGGQAVRAGEYGGPLVLFDTDLANVIIVSSINNFMVSSLNITAGQIRWADISTKSSCLPSGRV